MHHGLRTFSRWVVVLAVIGHAAVSPAAPLRKARFDLSKEAFNTVAKSLEAEGLYPVVLSGYEVGGQEKYAAVFEEHKPVEWEPFMMLPCETFLDKLPLLTPKGYRPLNLYPASGGDTLRVSCICVKDGSVGYQARIGLSHEDVQKLSRAYDVDKFRLVSLRGYDMGSEARFAALWEQRRIDAPPTEVQFDVSPSAFNQAAKKFAARKYAPVSLSTYTVAGKQKLAALWEKKPPDVVVEFRPMLSPDELQKQLDLMERKNLRVVDLQAYLVAGKPKFSLIWDHERPAAE